MKKKLYIIAVVTLFAGGLVVFFVLRFDGNPPHHKLDQPGAGNKLPARPPEPPPDIDRDKQEHVALSAELVYLLESIADLNAKEPVHFAREMALVLQKYNMPLTRKLEALDYRKLPGLASKQGWDEFVNRVTTMWASCDRLIRARKKAPKRLRDFYLDLLTAAATKTQSATVRLQAAYLLAKLGIPDVTEEPESLADVHPTSQQIADSFKSAFDALSDSSTNDLELAVGILVMNVNTGPPTYCYMWALADLYCSENDVMANIIQKLSEEEFRIVREIDRAVVDAPLARRLALAEVKKVIAHANFASLELPKELANAAVIRKRITGVCDPLIKAINNNDTDTAIRFLSPEYAIAWPRSARLLPAFASNPNVETIAIRGVGIPSQTPSPAGAKWSDVQIHIYFEEMAAGKINLVDRVVRFEARANKWLMRFDVVN